eukprot:TRINITY_DN1720_c0_g1_i1.p1 TRINITY_DN1720_c0_g1~~TRINITY_DN1720_c0_g1_i1.p1  ORF type:complete len:327 (+),score=92.31 TRINITY_DN1720_c0_g1_i1:178-1158(+)
MWTGSDDVGVDLDLPEYTPTIAYREEERRMCPERHGKPCEFEEDQKHGMMVCTHCGFVSRTQVIDEGQEWRDFTDSNKDSSRITKQDRFNTELSTTISAAVFRSSTDPTNPGPARHTFVGRKQESAEQRNRHTAFEKLTSLADVMSLSAQILDNAKELYTILDEKRAKLRGCRNDPVMCAILYLSCKKSQHPRTFREISKDTGISERDIKSAYRTLEKLLPSGGDEHKHTSPSALVERICQSLNLPFSVTSAAQRVADRAAQYVEGRAPASIAATAIFITCKNPTDPAHQRTEKEIATSANISVTTIKSVYTDLAEHQDELLAKTP